MIELKPAINEVKLTLKSISSPINLGTVVEPVSGGSVPSEVRQAIYTLLENAAYVTTGLEDEIAIVQAWAQEVTSLSLSETSLSLVDDTPVVLEATVLPAGSTITWSSSDESVATVVGGAVTAVGNGYCVITATAGGKTANCAVTVSGFATLESISAAYANKGLVLESDPLDSLKNFLTVTATYSDTSTEEISAANYVLSGTLAEGTSTITVSYKGKTTTFNVTTLGALPNEYQRVKYIEANQTTSVNGVYVNLGVSFSSPTKAVYKYGMIADTMSSWAESGYAMATRETGTGTNNRNGFVSGINSTKTGIPSWAGVAAQWIPDNPADLYVYHDVVATWTASAMTIQVDDFEPITESGTTRGCSGYNIGLFGDPSLKSDPVGASYLLRGKIYYAIAEQNDSPIFIGVPCYRKSDNKVGIYNLVNSTFKVGAKAGSSGSSSLLTAGDIYQ